MANHARVVELLDEERQELERLLRSQTSASGLVRRARAVLLMADGESGAQVARLTGYTPSADQPHPAPLRRRADGRSVGQAPFGPAADLWDRPRPLRSSL